MNTVLVPLQKSSFSEHYQTLVRWGELHAMGFRYGSGVEAVRVENSRSRLTWLPFQGQQIWSAEVDDQDLTMISMFSEPRLTRAYLENYGGFMLHCGATAMGVPGKGDTHALHGELPNAPYEKAYLQLGEDEQGDFIGLGGVYQHTIAFSANYRAEPLIKIYAGQTVLQVRMKITNLKHSPMELMYLAHINFRPVDGGQLVYSALPTPQYVRVRTSIPAHIQPPPGYQAFLEELSQMPEKHHMLTQGQAYDPEVVFSIDYLSDTDGWAHSLQIHPDGQADYVAHRPGQLKHGMRWISRTADQDALGIVLPATAEVEGYQAEKVKGNLVLLAPGESFLAEMLVGRVMESQAARILTVIEQTLNKAGQN